MNKPKVIFTPDGLPIGKGDRDLTYFYGLSDFWRAIFEDGEKIELLMEAQSLSLSDVYNRFLQLASTICIEDIEVATHQQIKLVLIKESDAVSGKVNTFTLPQTTLESKYIANRLFLPTAYLENNIHYQISEDGTEIQFFEPISSIGFANRQSSTGAREYALWMVDVIVDEDLLYEHYGKLIGVDPRTSSDNFKNFIYGLMYLYVNGPNLSLVRKGLNLALGIPLAREDETVLEIRKYVDTDQYLVITDLNSYLIPYGLSPTVSVGDTVTSTQELAAWVEVKDWINDGDWWINLQIPPAIMPYIPAGEPDRYAKAGTYADYLMRTYLKKHTFLVNVKTVNFKNLQSFEQLSEIINQVKPTYTTPIYIWTVPIPDEEIKLEETLTLRWDQFRCENLTVPIDKMIRLLANWATFTTDKHSEITVAGNQLTYTGGGTQRTARANTSIGTTTDVWYWEVVIEASATTPIDIGIGIASSSATLTTGLGADVNGWAYLSTGLKKHNGSSAAYGNTFTQGDNIGVKYDGSSGTVTFYKNGVSQGSAYTGITGAVYPAVSIGATTNYLRVNFGAQEFSYPPTSTVNPGVYTVGPTLTRGCPQFTRSTVSATTDMQLGGVSLINGVPRAFDGNGDVSGFGNIFRQFRQNTYPEKGILRAFMDRYQESYRLKRGTMMFDRGQSYYDNSGIGQREFIRPDFNSRVVFLYTTTQEDIAQKFAYTNTPVPSLDTWVFTQFEPYYSSAAINVGGINDSPSHNFYYALTALYSTFFFRDASVNYIGTFMPYMAYQTYAPLVTDIQNNDYLLFIRIYENTIGVYWVTSNFDVKAPAYWVANMTDPLSISSDNAEIKRGMGFYSTWYYLRGAGAAYTYGQGSAINQVGVNYSLNLGSSAAITVNYSDELQPSPIVMDRSGKILKMKRDFS